MEAVSVEYIKIQELSIVAAIDSLMVPTLLNASNNRLRVVDNQKMR